MMQGRRERTKRSFVKDDFQKILMFCHFVCIVPGLVFLVGGLLLKFDVFFAGLEYSLFTTTVISF